VNLTEILQYLFRTVYHITTRHSNRGGSRGGASGPVLIIWGIPPEQRRWFERERERKHGGSFTTGRLFFSGRTKIKNKLKEKEDEVSIASKEEDKEEIYHEVTEKRIDNPLYESQEHLEAVENDVYQSLPDKTNNNVLYQSPSDSITSNILYDR